MKQKDLGKNAINLFIKVILKEYYYCKKSDKKHFNENFVMSADNEQRFQSSNKCWICHILFDAGVRDHCYVTEKYRGSAHWSSIINLKLTKNVPVIFHNLKRYDSHLITQKNREIWCKSNWYTKCIRRINGFYKEYMTFAIINDLVFIDTMQFMNSNLNALVKNLSKMDFKYSSQEFGGDLLELVKQKGVYPY